MTITRPFSYIVLLAFLGALGCTGVAMAQQPPDAPAATATAAKAHASANHAGGSAAISKQTDKSPPQGTHAAQQPSSQVGKATAELAKGNTADHYQLRQRALIDQYQNAVTPPPAEIGR
jgi:hypothetical protein